MLKLPTQEEQIQIAEDFAEDLESFTATDSNGIMQPIICCVCDGAPTTPQWHTNIKVDCFADLCSNSNLHRKKIQELGIYPDKLLNQCVVNEPCLQEFILSPNSCINDNGEILVCKVCIGELKANKRRKQRSSTRKPPSKSIANGCAVGCAPPELTVSNETE